MSFRSLLACGMPKDDNVLAFLCSSSHLINLVSPVLSEASVFASVYSILLSIFCSVGLVVVVCLSLNLLSSVLKLFIILKDSFTGDRTLVCSFYFHDVKPLTPGCPGALGW